TPLPPRITLFPYTTLFRSMHFLADASTLNPHLLTLESEKAVDAVDAIINSPNVAVIPNGEWISTVAKLAGPKMKDALRTGTLARSEEYTSELQSPYDLVCR